MVYQIEAGPWRASEGESTSDLEGKVKLMSRGELLDGLARTRLGLLRLCRPKKGCRDLVGCLWLEESVESRMEVGSTILPMNEIVTQLA